MTRNISNLYRDLALAPSFPITFYFDNYISATLTDYIASQFFNLISINRTRANGFSINISWFVRALAIIKHDLLSIFESEI
jgi:hypothetical protein